MQGSTGYTNSTMRAALMALWRGGILFGRNLGEGALWEMFCTPFYPLYCQKCSREGLSAHSHVCFIHCLRLNFADSCEADTFVSYRTGAFGGQTHTNFEQQSDFSGWSVFCSYHSSFHFIFIIFHHCLFLLRIQPQGAISCVYRSCSRIKGRQYWGLL